MESPPLTDRDIATIRAKAAHWRPGSGRPRTFVDGPLDGLSFTADGDPEYIATAHLRDGGLLMILYRLDGGGGWRFEGLEAVGARLDQNR